MIYKSRQRAHSKAEALELTMSWRLVLICIASLSIAPAAFAEGGNACEILGEMEEHVQDFEDEEQLTVMQYREHGKLVKTFEMRVVTKGAHKALVSFLAPGSMTGTRILVSDPETVYAYLPEFRRVRRIASHALKQPFMGTNIYYEDISERWYSVRWKCRPQTVSDDSSSAVLTPRPGAKTSYSKLVAILGREPAQIERLEYYVGEKHIRTQIREDWRDVAGQERPGVIRYVSHDREAELRMEFRSWRVNVGVPDTAFSKRALIRGL